MDNSGNFIKKVPNLLTGLRLLLVPVMVFLLALEFPRSRDLAIAVFILAAVTDWIDGWVARRYAAISEAGKLLDPIADKLLVLSALIMLAADHPDPQHLAIVPAWLVALIVAREIWVTGMRAVAASGGLIVAADGFGKLKSLLQMIAVVMLLVREPVLGLPFSAAAIGICILAASVVFGSVAAYRYTRVVIKRL